MRPRPHFQARIALLASRDRHTDDLVNLGDEKSTRAASPQRAWIAGALATAALMAAAVAAALVWNDGGTRAVADPGRPNVIWLMTDDQDVASMSAMPKTRRMLGARGVTFANSIAAWPLCCPSRVTFQTGQHAHNHGVLENRPPLGGFKRFDPGSALPVWLQEAGYRTAHVGQYINGYKKFDGVPPGWDEWQGLGEPSNRYFKPKMNENGEIRRHANLEDANYSTDLFTTKATRFIENQGGSQVPFFLSVGYVAPHGGPAFRDKGRCADDGPEPAPRHVRAFDGEPLPKSPSFNESDVSDKPGPISEKPRIEGSEMREAIAKYRCRLESLLAVDDSVAKIVRALRRTGELDNTYVFFTSDNGYVQGEHRIRGGKSVLYEESLRVPLLVRGPGLPQGETSHDLISNVDWAPTILDIAGARAGRRQDGVSLLAAARQPAQRRGRALLIESARERYQGVRTDRFVYAEYYSGGEYGADDVEIYDLRRDPYQLQNVRDDPEYDPARDQLQRLLDRLRRCKGAGCEARPRVFLVALRGGSPDGGSCSSPRTQVRIEGGDADVISDAQIHLPDGKRLEVGAQSVAVAVPAREAVWIRARVELVDGRVADIRARLPGCNDEPA
jgi:N-acetylglucosamine-6-sulfatase